MVPSRALWLGLFALTLLTVEVAPVFADIPSPDGRPYQRTLPPLFPPVPPPMPLPQPEPQPPQPPPIPPPAPLPPIPDLTTPPTPQPTPQPTPRPKPAIDPTAIDPAIGFPPPPRQVDPPKRTGPFRSCGSGMGTGLAGIAVAWALLWLGNRFIRSWRSSSDRG
jgi:hypothetical protein